MFVAILEVLDKVICLVLLVQSLHCQELGVPVELPEVLVGVLSILGVVVKSSLPLDQALSHLAGVGFDELVAERRRGGAEVAQ